MCHFLCYCSRVIIIIVLNRLNHSHEFSCPSIWLHRSTGELSLLGKSSGSSSGANGLGFGIGFLDTILLAGISPLALFFSMLLTAPSNKADILSFLSLLIMGYNSSGQVTRLTFGVSLILNFHLMRYSIGLKGPSFLIYSFHL